MLMEKKFEKIIPLKIKSFSPEGSFFGYASRYTVDLEGDQILPQAFSKTLEKLKKCSSHLQILWQHEKEHGPIGFCRSLYEDHQGLRVSGQLLLWKSQGRQAYKMMQRGLIQGLSIGFIPIKIQQDFNKNIRQISELDLQEVSLVDQPANPLAYVEEIKNFKADHLNFGVYKMDP